MLRLSMQDKADYLGGIALVEGLLDASVPAREAQQPSSPFIMLDTATATCQCCIILYNTLPHRIIENFIAFVWCKFATRKTVL